MAFSTLDSITKKYNIDFTMEKADRFGYNNIIVNIFCENIYTGQIGALLNAQGLYYYYNNDHNNAKKYFLKAMEKNNTNAMYNYAIFYEQDIRKRNELVKKAIDNGNYCKVVLNYKSI